MMKELRNVLTVRTATKTSLKVTKPRKRKSKHIKKNGKMISQSNQISNQLTKDMNDGIEQCTVILPDASSDMQRNDNVKVDTPLITCDTTEDVSRDSEDNIQDTLHDISNDEESNQKIMLEDVNPIMMRHVATMAAKMALKQSAGSHKQEEVFGSEH